MCAPAFAAALCAAAACRRPEPAPPAPAPAPAAAPERAPAAPPDGAIRYTLRFPTPHTHHVEVDATVPVEPGEDGVELMLPVWTPGSYLVREHARHVESLRAFDAAGAERRVDKTRKNRWRVEAAGTPAITVRYRLWAREWSVRESWVGPELAAINGPPTFLTRVDQGRREAPARPHDVRLELPAAWKAAYTALAPHPDGAPHHYRAPDYDTLLDSPIVAGDPEVRRFEVEGVEHLLVTLGGGGVWDQDAAARDVEAIVRAQARFWGGLPYRRYLFLNVLGEGGGGGLEHRESTLLVARRWALRRPADRRDWLGLVSHELFHAWNVTRMRPEGLWPYDYEAERYTDGLWVAEGFTSYYDDLLLARAGLLDRDEYLRRLSRQIERLQTTPGRELQPLARASFDAWIEHYRPDANSPSSAVSYYTKGAVVALLLDARVREASGGRHSLDDAMRLAFARFSGGRGYTTATLRETVEEVAGADLGPWFHRAVESTDELDYAPALAWFGLRFKPADQPKEDDPPAGWLGAKVRDGGGRVLVTEVPRGAPAYDAGLDVDDELLAIDGFRVADLADRLSRYRPGDRVTLLIARRERVLPVEVTLGERPAETWSLEPDPAATPAQRARLSAWLAPPPPRHGR